METTAQPGPNTVQVGGDHYIKQSIQPWDYMQAVMTQEEFAAYLQGNVIKYISRYKAKNGVQDLQKAQHYLAKLIATFS
mgnify:CR=1 FL=1